jgi:hypothetical protein
MQTHVQRRLRDTDDGRRFLGGEPLPCDKQQHLTVSVRERVECLPERLAELIVRGCLINLAGEPAREALASF